MKARAVFAILLVLTASLSAGLSYWYAQSISAPSIGNTQEPGSASRDCDYTFYIDGSTYLATKGDGSGNKYSGTSGTTVISNAITDGGAGLYCFQPGTFVAVISPLPVSTGIHLRGAGMGITIIQQPASINGDVISGSSLTDISITDLSINGNKANNPTGDNGISITSLTGGRIERVESYNNILKGIALSDTCSNVLINGVELHTNDQDGIGLASGTIAGGTICKDVTITNSFIHDNSIYGIGLVMPSTLYSRTENIIIANNHILNSATYGIEVIGAKYPIIIGNYIEESVNHGIDLGSVTAGFNVINPVVMGNTIKNGQAQGIRLQSVNNATIIGNTVFDDQTPKTQTYAIGINAIIGGGTIEGNNLGGNLNGAVTGTAELIIIRNNNGYNPVGKITNFIMGTTHFAPWGTSSAVGASTTYTITGVDEFITTTGGTGVSINIACGGNNYVSAATTLTNQLVWIGCTINFGAFSVAPTVTVFGN